jgi:hypothetical protein
LEVKNQNIFLVKKEEKGYTVITGDSPKRGHGGIERAGLSFVHS